MPANSLTPSSAMPTLSSDRVISYALNTHLTVVFDHAISYEGLKFLNHARKNAVTRKMSRYDADFRKHLSVDGYDTSELMEILQLVHRASVYNISFTSDTHLERWRVNQALRGLDVLHNLSILGKNMKVESGYGHLRINENEIRKVEYVDGQWMVTNGWVKPVWSEKSYRIG